MFFTEPRLHLFKPLTGKYREQVIQCLCLLYQRQYSASADYGSSLSRETVIELFCEALTRTAGVELDTEEGEQDQRFRSERELATWVLKSVLDAGWIERQVDTATFQSSYPFSRTGRLLTQALLDVDTANIRTRHRNTRNTLNALEAFSSRGDVYDLLDALDYSERIITDFTDIITELDDRKRELVKEVEARQLAHEATDQFFDYMEKRFQPDISVRLSADSVEKHRDAIRRVIHGIKRKPKSFKHEAERDLRACAPQLCEHERSYLYFALDTIEQRMRNAAEIMLPALRRALHGFTRRADLVIRQLSYLNAQDNDDLVDICRELADLNDTEFDARMHAASAQLATLDMGLIDPRQIKLQERRKRAQVDTRVDEPVDIDDEARNSLMVQQLLDQAFLFNRADLHDHLLRGLRQGGRIRASALPIENARDLLTLAHIIEAGSVNSRDSDKQFVMRYIGQTDPEHGYFHSSDDFEIQLIDARDESDAAPRTQP